MKFGLIVCQQVGNTKQIQSHFVGSFYFILLLLCGVYKPLSKIRLATNDNRLEPGCRPVAKGGNRLEYKKPCILLHHRRCRRQRRFMSSLHR